MLNIRVGGMTGADILLKQIENSTEAIMSALLQSSILMSEGLY